MPVPGDGKIKKLFHKSKKPLNTQRVVISDTQKYGFQDDTDEALNTSINLEPIDFTDLDGESFLEDTPSEGEIANKASARKKHRNKKSKEILAEKPVSINNKSTEKPVVFNAKPAEKRYKKSKKSFLDIFAGFRPSFTRKSKTSNSYALEFAGSGKRLGKKGRRNRRIFVYAGTGVFAVVLTLVIVLVPGEAAPAGNQTPGTTQPSTQTSALVVNNSGEVSSATVSPGEVSESPSVTPSPTPTQTEIPTTPPDVTTPVIDLTEEVKTFMVKADKYYNEIGYSNNHYKKVSDKERYMLAQVMYGEARGSFNGMIAVGNVVMNRVLSRAYPGNTITEVVTAPHQFSGYNPDRVPSSQAKAAANYVLDYEKWIIPQNIYHFRSGWPDGQAWAGRPFYKNIGGNCFFTSTKYGRTGKIPPPMFERTYKWPTMGCKPEMRVYKLQYMLNKLGYDVKADKYFGQDTKDAIISFQKKHKLKSDGIAGEGTLKALIKEFGYDKYYEAFYEDN